MKLPDSSTDNSTDHKNFLQKYKPWLLQLILFVLFLIAISWWQTKDMYASNKPLAQTEISLPNTKGELISYQFDNQQNQTLIYFFATWCGICHLSINNLESVYQSKPDNLEIVVIALDWQSINEVEDFVKEHDVSVPILLGTGQTQQAFKITAYPSYYLISEKATILSKDSGYSTELGLNWRIGKLFSK